MTTSQLQRKLGKFFLVEYINATSETGVVLIRNKKTDGQLAFSYANLSSGLCTINGGILKPAINDSKSLVLMVLSHMLF